MFRFFDEMLPYRDQIISKAGELASKISVFLVNSLSAGAIGTVNFIFMFFVFLYVSYFFLLDGTVLLDRILYYLPLKDKDEKRLLDRFTSVTRATLKGTALIGLLQGGLAGLGFAVVGIEAAVFWGTVMAALTLYYFLRDPLPPSEGRIEEPVDFEENPELPAAPAAAGGDAAPATTADPEAEAWLRRQSAPRRGTAAAALGPVPRWSVSPFGFQVRF